MIMFHIYDFTYDFKRQIALYYVTYILRNHPPKSEIYFLKTNFKQCQTELQFISYGLRKTTFA